MLPCLSILILALALACTKDPLSTDILAWRTHPWPCQALNISLIELSAPPLNSAISSQQDPVLTSKSAICEYVLNQY